MKKIGRLPVVSDEIKFILSNIRKPGAAITRKVVIAVGSDVLSARCSEK